jgi:uncharacterized membrane protein YeaQ/YmgE (transglycosylase-associated protein family)
MIINLILQAIAGAIAGNAAAAGLDKADLGRAANTIAGAIGGVGAGQIVSALLPTLAAAARGSTSRPSWLSSSPVAWAVP